MSQADQGSSSDYEPEIDEYLINISKNNQDNESKGKNIFVEQQNKQINFEQQNQIEQKSFEQKNQDKPTIQKIIDNNSPNQDYEDDDDDDNDELINQEYFKLNQIKQEGQKISYLEMEQKNQANMDFLNKIQANELDIQQVMNNELKGSGSNNGQQFEQNSIIQEGIQEQIVQEDTSKQKIQAIKDYQFEVFLQARKQNTIVYLETGTGKTLISILNIYYQLKKNPQKKIIFIANTQQLLLQQFVNIQNQLEQVADIIDANDEYRKIFDEEGVQIKGKKYFQKDKDFRLIHGNNKNDLEEWSDKSWTKVRWDKIMKNSKVIVIIGQIFLNALRRGFVKMSDLQLIVFDECHHANKQHAFNLIMYEFYRMPKYLEQKKQKKIDENQNSNQYPLIMGLTASPMQNIEIKSHQQVDEELAKCIQKLQNNLQSKFAKIDYNKVKMNEPQVIIQNINNKDQFNQLKNINDKNQQRSEYKKLIGYLSQIKSIDKNMHKFFEQYIQSVDLNREKPKLLPQNQQFFEQILFEFIFEALIIKIEIGYDSFIDYCQQIEQQVSKKSDFKQDQQSLEKVQTLISDYIKIFKEYKKKQIDKEKTHKLKSYKFEKLKEIIKSYQEKCLNHKQFPKTVIFVSSRTIARQLQKELKQFLDQLNLKCDYVMGTQYDEIKNNYLKNESTSTLDLSQIDMLGINAKKVYNQQSKFDINDYEIDDSENQKKLQVIMKGKENSFRLNKYTYNSQKAVIEGFRKNLLNILISTSVIEEGFDIPNCSLVIQYDKFPNYQQFIQMKGRARLDQSAYILLSYSEQEQQLFEQKQQQYKNLSKTIKIFSQNDYQIDYAIDDFKGEYKQVKIASTGALLNTNNAKDILHHFTNSLIKSDNFSLIGNRPYYKLYKKNGFICIIILPDNAPQQIFEGEIKSKKETAIRYACYKAVQQLYKNGFINSDLKPRYQAIVSTIQDYQNGLLTFDNEQYNEIKKNAIICEGDKMYFQKFIKEGLYFNFTNPDHCILQNDDQQVVCQLYLIEYLEVEKKVLNTQFKKQNQYLGFIHSSTSPINEHLFREKRGKYKMKILEPKLKLNKQQFEKLRLFHLHNAAIAVRQEPQFYGRLQQQDIKQDGYFYKGGNNQILFDLDLKNMYLLSTILKKVENQNDKFEIDWDTVNQTLEFIEIMKNLFNKYNNLDKNVFEEQKFTLDLKFDEKWLVKSEDYEEADDGKGLILQYVKCDMFFQKFRVQSMKQTWKEWKQQQLQQVNDQDNDKQENPKQKINLMEERGIRLKKIFNIEINDDERIVTGRTIRRKLKTDYQLFQCINKEQPNIDEISSQNYFLKEFIKFPLCYNYIFQMFFFLDFGIFQVRDLFLTQHFKNFLMDNFQINSQDQSQEQLLQIQQGEQQQQFLQTHESLSNIFTNQFLKSNFEKQKQLNEEVQKQLKIKQQKMEEFIQQQQNNQKQCQLKQYIQNLPLDSLHQALKTRQNDSYENYERQEFLGDTVLKLLTTVQIFSQNPNYDEEIMTLKRIQLVSNKMLWTVAVQNKIFYYLFCEQVKDIPVGLINIKNQQVDSQDLVTQYQNQINQMREYKKIGEKQIIPKTGDMKYIPLKVLPDIIESLLGAIFEQYTIKDGNIGLDICWKLLQSLKILNVPNVVFQNTISDSQIRDITKNLSYMKYIQEFEKNINYKFKNINFLLRALSSSQCVANTKILKFRNKNEDIDDDESKKLYELMNINSDYKPLSYERLEFLGDAVLDLIVVNYIYNKKINNKFLQPGELTKIKHSIVKNTTLALMCVEIDLYKISFHETREKKDSFKTFCEKIKRDKKITDTEYIKMLGDLIEAFIGAIYLDTNYNFEQTNKVVLNILSTHLEYYSKQEYINDYPLKQLEDFLKQKYGSKNEDFPLQFEQDVPEIGQEDKKLNFKILFNTGRLFQQIKAKNEKDFLDQIPILIEKLKKPPK